uniref:Putative secreted protein n=1 Tax=Ixodes ricinus TaxID=34613 RepID=A0A6B0U9S6_IXORI
MIFLFWHLRNFVVAKWISAEQHYGSFFSSILIILLRQVMQDTQHPLLGKGCLQHIFHNLSCSLLAGIASLDCFQDCFSPVGHLACSRFGFIHPCEDRFTFT